VVNVRKHSSIVIAKYNEDISWADKYICNKYIYSKNDDDKPCIKPPHHLIKLRNFGRESQTYFHHIVENYHNLTNNVLFLQGDPFDDYPRDEKRIERLLTNDSLTFVRQIGYEVDLYHNYYWARHQLDLKGLLKYLNLEYGGQYICPSTSCFAVTKEIIHRRSHDFYYRCLIYHENNPKAPWEFEFSWPLIFNQEIDKKEIASETIPE